MGWERNPDTELVVPESGGIETIEPYVHWFYRDGADDLLDRALIRYSSPIFQIVRDLWRFPASQVLDPPDIEDLPEASKKSDTSHLYKAKELSDGAGVLLPLPKGAQNPDALDVSHWDHAGIAKILPDDVEEDTVIVGIIDTGISLGHNNFRNLQGQTRFIASWQQGAKHETVDREVGNAASEASRQLPFGREVFASEINDALGEFSGGSLTGNLDEDSFNRRLGLVDTGDPTGQRDLDLAAAHGTHVLDLAAGHVPLPGEETEEAMRRQRIIAVNLPAQHTHGTAGNFLAYLADMALRRIIFLADALWLKKFGPPKQGENDINGFPIVINFSYGMQAGPKDGSLLFERLMQDAVTSRAKGMNSQIRVAMPAGNEAQNRGAASAVLGAEGVKHCVLGYTAKPQINLPWRLSPADHTSNYMEIWSEYDSDYKHILDDLKLFVTPPGHGLLEVENLELGRHYDLAGDDGKLIARVYCELMPRAESESGKKRDPRRIRILICTAPTLSFEPDAAVAPAGCWNVELRYNLTPVDFSFYVQSDQSAVRASKNGMRSYFDHPNYETHVLTPPFVGKRKYKKYPFGGLRDSYHYDPIHGYDDAEYWPLFGPVQRLGTLNALASADKDNFLVCIGGYVGLSGRPAWYSGATNGNPTDEDVTRRVVTVSFISETAPNHFGLLAAGSRNGSVAAYRGTSMATALATRYIVDAFMATPKSRHHLIGNEPWLREMSQENEENSLVPRKDHWGQNMPWYGSPILKLGVERIGLPESFQKNRVSRLGG